MSQVLYFPKSPISIVVGDCGVRLQYLINVQVQVEVLPSTGLGT